MSFIDDLAKGVETYKQIEDMNNPKPVVQTPLYIPSQKPFDFNFKDPKILFIVGIGAAVIIKVMK